MSRNITSKNTSFTEEDYKLQNTQSGKLLFTRIRDRMCALLIQQDRLTAVQVLPDNPGKIGAVYLGKVKNVVKNIDACFVEIADKEFCFLPLKDAQNAFITNRIPDGRILEGDELLVQVTRDAQKTKQASVTANISISNDIFAISLGKPGTGYSNKLSKSDKQRLQEYINAKGVMGKYISALSEQNAFSEKLKELLILQTGLVVRTRAGVCSDAELDEAMDSLLTEWVNLLKNAMYTVCFTCISEAPTDFEAVLQQVVYPYEYSEIITDDPEQYNKLTTYVAGHFQGKSVRLYEDSSFSLSKLYGLETKIKTALDTRIWLKSGGYLIIEPTEALTVIDVNSGKYEAKKGNQDAIFKVNREAAEEVALQLRLRNLSGIIIVDFINMESKEMQEQLLEYLRTLVRNDKQKTVVVDMTPLGLVEITRKKSNKPLHEQFKEV